MADVDDGLEDWAESQSRRSNPLYRIFVDSHYAIERFGVVTVVFIVSAALILAGTIANIVRSRYEATRSTASYSSTFTMASTEQKGTIGGPYLSNDGKRAVLVMSFDNPEDMSLDASNYTVKVTATDTKLKKQTLKTPITGWTAFFGDTGSFVIVMDAADVTDSDGKVTQSGFANQILVVDLTSAVTLVAKSDVSGDDNTDTARFYVNPGADNVQRMDDSVSAAFDRDKPDFRMAYWWFLVHGADESDIRSDLDDDLEKLRSDLATAEEYRQRLQSTTVNGHHVVIPKTLNLETDTDTVSTADFSATQPVQGSLTSSDGTAVDNTAVQSQVQAAGGTATGASTDGTNQADDAAGGDAASDDATGRTAGGSPSAASPSAGSSGSTDTSKYRGHLNLNSPYVVAGGVNFQWRTGDLYKGYLSQFDMGGSAASDWLNVMGAASDTFHAPQQTEWLLDDGTQLYAASSSSGASSMSSTYDSLQQLVDKYVSVCMQYHTDKVQYEHTDLMRLLTLENSMDNTVANVGTNMSGDALTTW